MPLAFALAAALLATGCARKARPYTAHEAADALVKQAAQVRTARGRAWVSFRWRVEGPPGAAAPPQRKLSFPAIVAIDRDDATRPRLRIEAIDPFGSTHALLLLERDQRLQWIDYDRRAIAKARDIWSGIPLAKLPELLLGISTLPPDARVSSADAGGFEVRSGANLFHYEMDWIDPGPRLALAGIAGDLPLGRKRERYVVRYSKYLDKDDFYLPQETEILGYSRPDGIPATSGNERADVELHLAWRERRWNEKIPDAVFALPKTGLEGFTLETSIDK